VGQRADQEAIRVEDLVTQERFEQLQALVTEPVREYLRARGEVFDAERVATLRKGCLALGRGKDRPKGFYCTEAGTWGYWYSRFVRNAYQAMIVFRFSGWECHSKHLLILQLGGGPAEDLVGVLDHLNSFPTPKPSVTYISVDVGSWDPFLDEVRQNILPKLFSKIHVELRPQHTCDIRTAHLERLITPDPAQPEFLVIVANTLVTSTGEEGLSSNHIVECYVQLVESLGPRVHSLLIIEPQGLEENVATCMRMAAAATGTDYGHAVSSGCFLLTYPTTTTDVRAAIFPGGRKRLYSRRCYGLLKQSPGDFDR